MPSLLALAVSVSCMLGTSLVSASPCAIEGDYIRKDGANLSVSAVVESTDGSIGASARVQAFGNIAPDGAPRYGNLEGELQLSRDHCTGVLVSEQNQCKLVFIFTDRAGKVYEIGSCFTGTGVSGDGVYLKQPGPNGRKATR